MILCDIQVISNIPDSVIPDARFFCPREEPFLLFDSDYHPKGGQYDVTSIKNVKCPCVCRHLTLNIYKVHGDEEFCYKTLWKPWPIEYHNKPCSAIRVTQYFFHFN